jgi:molecular chaperone DnaK
MGASFDQSSKEVARVPYKVVKGDNNTPRVKLMIDYIQLKKFQQ